MILCVCREDCRKLCKCYGSTDNCQLYLTLKISIWREFTAFYIALAMRPIFSDNTI